MTYTYKGYKIFKADNGKKYYALVEGKKVYFGDANYEQFHDKLGAWKHKDHGDIKRRDAYRARHNYEKKEGTPGWFSWNILW